MGFRDLFSKKREEEKVPEEVREEVIEEEPHKEEDFPLEYEFEGDIQIVVEADAAETDAGKGLVTDFIKCVKEYIDNAYEDQKDNEEPEEEEKENVTLKPVDSKILTGVSKDEQLAVLCLCPPANDGKDVTGQEILDTLKKVRITFGIREERLMSLAEGKQYLTVVLAAKGEEPVPGNDGYVEDFFERESHIKFQEDEKGNVDFKNLNLFQGITKDELICKIIPPTPGTNGRTVYGREVPYPGGKKADIPMGDNTYLDEDETELRSSRDGYISFSHGKFKVQDQLVIKGNVDNSVGNLDFNGDIVVRGDVSSGFELKATGDISIYGMVEGAKLTAGGDIQVVKGMNGNRRGELTAGGDIEARFLENSVISAKGDIQAESIINCGVSSGGSVYATKGKGIIIGGTIMVSKRVEAKRIGNQSDTDNFIMLGVTKQKEEEREEAKKELKEVQRVLPQLSKNLEFLKGREIPEGKKELFNRLLEQESFYKEKEEELQKRIEELDNEAINFSECGVKADIIYPYTKISLSYSKLVVKETTAKCNIFYSKKDNELKLGLN